jgi:hypothetical protein
MRKTSIVAAIFTVLWAVPAHPAAATIDTDLLISPQHATIGPNGGAVVTIAVSSGGEIPVYLTWTPQPPPGLNGSSIVRNGQPCKRDSTADYRCDERGTITITYQSVTDEALDGIVYELAARPEGGRRSYSTVTVAFPEPEPTPTGTTTQQPSADPSISATTTTSNEPSPTPEVTAGTSTAADPSEPGSAPAEPAGGGINTTAVAVFVATTGGTGAAAALATFAWWWLRRRRQDHDADVAASAPDVTVTVDDEDDGTGLGRA